MKKVKKISLEKQIQEIVRQNCFFFQFQESGSTAGPKIYTDVRGKE